VTVHVDGAARGNPGPAGVGIVISGGSSRKPSEMYAYLGEATNNVAETVALVLALQEVLRRGEKQVVVRTDSELLANQVNGDYKVKDKQLIWFHVLIRHLVGCFDKFEIRHVPREGNRHADKLANRAVNEGLRKNPRPPAQPREEVQSPGSNQPTFWSES